MRTTLISALVAGCVGVSTPALAQRLPFERSFDAAGAATLDIATDRGQIDVSAGEPGRIVVSGTVTVRVGWNVPVNAVELARRVAASPPIERRGNTFVLRTPTDEAERRAVTVAYQVRVPPDTTLVSLTDSGATTITGLAGETSVTTHSSAFTGRDLQGRVRLRTQSGAIDAVFSGPGSADVETGSSGIRVSRVQGRFTARTQSGGVVVDGTPTEPWTVTTGSSAIEMRVRSGLPFRLDAMSRSSDVEVKGATLQGTMSKGRASGTIGGEGPLIQADSRSGRITVTVR